MPNLTVQEARKQCLRPSVEQGRPLTQGGDVSEPTVTQSPGPVTRKPRCPSVVLIQGVKVQCEDAAGHEGRHGWDDIFSWTDEQEDSRADA